MATITIPDELKLVVDARAAESGYASVDEYVAAVIRADLATPISAALEQEILAGLATPSREMTSADWDEMRRRFTESRLAAAAKP